MFTPETCQFIPLSALNLSDDARTLIEESALTFGDSNRTLVTLSRINEYCSFGEDDDTAGDQEILNTAINELGEDFYVDLEN